MNVNPMLLLIMGLLGGLVAGALLVAWWYEGHEQPLASEEEEEAATPAEVSAMPEPPPPPPPPATLLSLRRATDGGLEVYLQGIRLASPDGITADQRQQLISLVVELRPWVTDKPSQAPAPAAPKASTPPPPSPAVHVNVTPVEEPAAAPAPLRSIALQIDDVLQEMLETSPLKSRGISLREGPDHSVIVWVGAQTYAGIEDVPDPEIKSLLRAAVEEWQRRNLPE